jgi:DNA-binding HxlR family transcriptional regulator
MKKEALSSSSTGCKTRILAINDSMEILAGKWKFHIIGTLMLFDKLRFMELLREVDGIGAKMLSKELQDLEMNHLIRRTVLNTKPLTVEYELTDCGKTLGPIIDEIAKWGITYRSTLYQKNGTSSAAI